MGEQWSVSGPTVIEVGGPEEPVREVVLTVVSGRVSVIAHDEDVALLEVGSVAGPALEVAWEGGVLSVAKPQVAWGNLLSQLGGHQRRDVAELTVAVPRGTAVRIGTVDGEGLVSGVHAVTAARTVSGSLVVDGVRGAVTARTVSGRLDVRDQRGALTSETVSGSLTAQVLDAPTVEAKTVSGRLAVDLRCADAHVRLSSVSGDLTCRVPDDAEYRLRALTVSGDVVSDGRRLGRGRLGGRVSDGAGSLQLHVTSVSGDVVVVRDRARGGADDAAAGAAGGQALPTPADLEADGERRGTA